MKIKSFEVKYKDVGNGQIEGYASTWIRKPDSYGDVVKQGAFTKTLAERWKGGKGIPFLWAHKMDDLGAFIGTADANEDEIGLHFVASFDDTEEAQRVRGLYKDGRLKKFSFAYDVIESGMVTLEDGILTGGFGAGVVEEEKAKKEKVSDAASGESDSMPMDVRPEDLVKFGLIPEFTGRLPVITTMKELSEDDLVRVLTEPKNSLVKQYQKLLAMDGVELKFEEDALKELAKSALARKTGARGLRAEMERLMTDIMYDAPGNAKMKKVTITKKMIEEL